jgi:uncharacterized protein (TIGR01777 family)
LVVNLAGLPIAGGLWTKSRKVKLLDSRIGVTQSLVAALNSHSITVGHFISASAIGFYGTGAHRVTEQDTAGNDFSAELCSQWEAAALDASTVSDKVSLLRTGLVLSRRGGYLEPLEPFAKLGLQMQFGNGRQGLSWIDERDWLAALELIIDRELTGPVNLTAPNPVSQRVFIDQLAQQTKKGLTLPIFSPFLLPLGEMNSLFLKGQFVIPKKLIDAGFTFQFPSLGESLASLFNRDVS